MTIGLISVEDGPLQKANAMPDGFEPHQELARIYTLKDLMQQCRERLPLIMSVLDEALHDDDIAIRLQAAQMTMDRGFGKPRQHMMLSSGSLDSGATTRVVILPDNGRKDQPLGRIIDAE